jgi:sulfur transfer protein SufE
MTSDLVTVFEIARVGLAMVFDEIAEELDISDAELQRIRQYINASLDLTNKKEWTAEKFEPIQDDDSQVWMKWVDANSYSMKTLKGKK